MVWETGVQSQVESYSRLKEWHLMSPCLTLSIMRYGSRVKWSNPGKGVASSPTPQCSSYWKGSLLVALDYGSQLYFIPSLLVTTVDCCYPTRAIRLSIVKPAMQIALFVYRNISRSSDFSVTGMLQEKYRPAEILFCFVFVLFFFVS